MRLRPTAEACHQSAAGCFYELLRPRGILQSVVMALLIAGVGAVALAQYVPDTAFRPSIERPAFLPNRGPVVLLDEAHFNYHTSTGRYLPFAELLRSDGFIVRASTGLFGADSLRGGSVLVISNALNQSNQRNWNPPNPPAFTAIEVDAVRDWVVAGGALMLIADHRPFAGAAETLGRAFGIRFLDGAVTRRGSDGRIIFRKSEGTLIDDPITNGIDAVATFTGSSFELDTVARPLLRFGPETYSSTGPNDPNPVPVSGRLQGAVLAVGKGKVAVFGEAAMFSAQLSGPDRSPMGMNAPAAKQNPQFLLNVMRWLVGAL